MTSHQPSPPWGDNLSDQIDFREYVAVLGKHRRFILFAVGLATLATLMISLLLPKVYEARVSILVREDSGSGGGLGALGGLGAAVGISLPGSRGNVKDDLIDLLRSDLLADQIVDDLGLRQVWSREKTAIGLRKRLKGIIKVPGPPETNLVVIRTEYTDAALAASIANAVVDALGTLNAKLGYTEASRKRKFIDEQLPKVEEELKAAEDRLKAFTSLLPRGAMGGSLAEGSATASVDVARLVREVEVQNAVYTLLRKELETTKLEEAKSLDPFLIVDRAEVLPDKIAPKIKQNMVLAFLTSFMASVVFVFGKEWWTRVKS